MEKGDLFVDAIEMAKIYQWQIEMLDDPVEAALEANKALVELSHMTDDRLSEGTTILVGALGAYAINLWHEEKQRNVTLQYEPLVVVGESAGISFIQNITDHFRLKTIFVGIRNGRVLQRGPDGEGIRESETLESVPRMIVPILEVESIIKAA